MVDKFLDMQASGTDPTAPVEGYLRLYVHDASGVPELRVMDASGNDVGVLAGGLRLRGDSGIHFVESNGSGVYATTFHGDDTVTSSIQNTVGPTVGRDMLWRMRVLAPQGRISRIKMEADIFQFGPDGSNVAQSGLIRLPNNQRIVARALAMASSSESPWLKQPGKAGTVTQ